MALLIERCGPLFLYIEQTRPSMNYELNHVKDMCMNGIVDRDSASILMNAYYTCRPEERPVVRRVELPPQQRYLRYLLTEELRDNETDEHVEQIVSKIRKFPLHVDEEMEVLVQEIFRVPSVCSPKIQSIAHVCCVLSHYIPRFKMMLINAIYEQLLLLLDLMRPDKYQETLSLMIFCSELYIFQTINDSHILFILYLLIEYNHYVSLFRQSITLHSSLQFSLQYFTSR